MKVLRWFLAGLAFGVIAQIVGGIVYMGIFPHWYESCRQLFRPMDHPYFMIGLPLMNLVQGLLLAIVYAVLYNGIPAKTPVLKGIVFGLLLWLVGPLTGMLTDFCVTTMRFPLPCLIYTFVGTVVGCLSIAVIWGKSLEKKAEG
ncbi:MAG: hypothetical protein QME42_02650 [bacterium]|nr:hypothetical protein [bacterium]